MFFNCRHLIPRFATTNLYRLHRIGDLPVTSRSICGRFMWFMCGSISTSFVLAYFCVFELIEVAWEYLVNCVKELAYSFFARTSFVLNRQIFS